MDKWKIIVVVLLLGALGGYGWMQQNAAQEITNPPAGETPVPSDQASNNTTAVAQTPVPPAKQSNAELFKLRGKVPPAWNIDKQYWVNTTAPVTLQSLKGSVAIVEFWRIGCSHCQQAAPFLNAIYQKNKSRGLKMVAIQSPGLPGNSNPENDWNTVQQAVKQFGITYPVAQDVDGKIFKQVYGGDTYPATMILDRDSKVRAIFSGHTPLIEIQLTDALEAELKKK